jgi:hypothetical protein
MRTLTLRTLLARESLLQVLKEPEFEHNMALGIVKDNFVKCDDYFAIFVFTAESQDDGKLFLRVASTTVVGVQRHTTKRLQYQGVYVNPNVTDSDVLMETLRAHYRAAQQDTFERINAIGTHGIPFVGRRTFRTGQAICLIHRNSSCQTLILKS